MAKARALDMEVQMTKIGPGGRPSAEVLVDASMSLSDVSASIQKNITRNVDVLKKVGLRACGSCISGFDIWIRQRYDDMLRIDLKQVG